MKRFRQGGIAVVLATALVAAAVQPVSAGEAYDPFADSGEYTITGTRDRAEGGDPVAQLELGQAYVARDTSLRNPVEARRWLGRAAAGGHLPAMTALADLLESGVGGSVDLTQALALYRQAATAGHLEAMIRLGHPERFHLPMRPSEAEHWLRAGAERNDPACQVDLALSLAERKGGSREAIRWLVRAAPRFDLAAQLLQEAAGEPSLDLVRLFASWRRHARAGNDRAKFWLAFAASRGIGGAVDRPGALRDLAERGSAIAAYYFSKAVADEDPDAAWSWLVRAADGGYAAAKLEASGQRPAWLREAAEQGLPLAMERLGAALIPVGSTRAEGRRWLEKAARRGDGVAAVELGGDPFLHGMPLTDAAQHDSFEWIQRAAGLGEYRAIVPVCAYFANLPVQAAEARRLLERGAELRLPEAMLALGSVLAAEPASASQAVGWYAKARGTQPEDALKCILTILDKVPGAAAGYPEVQAWVEREANLGDLPAEIVQGRMAMAGRHDWTGALAWFHRASTSGYHGALVALGDWYAAPGNPDRDDALAIARYREAIERDHDRELATRRLLALLLGANGHPRDVAAAIGLLRDRRLQIPSEFLLRLARLYETGDGVRQDLDEAFRMLSSTPGADPALLRHLHDFAGSLGHFKLVDGVAYEANLRRRIVGGDVAAARTWGFRLLMFDRHGENLAEALANLERAARAGDLQAMRVVYQIYREGVTYFPYTMVLSPDHAKAERWSKALVAAGDVAAMLERARDLDVDTPTSRREGFRLATVAAGRGLPEAELYLSSLFAEGGVTERNGPAAVAWALKALRHGEKSAYGVLAGYYEEGRCVPRDLHQAYLWAERGARAGDSGSLVQLARAFEEGLGVAPSRRTAIRLYTRAFDRGSRERGDDLARLLRAAPPGSPDGNRALYWYLCAHEHDSSAVPGPRAFGKPGAVGILRQYRSLAAAEMALAGALVRGDGVPKSPRLAASWLDSAMWHDQSSGETLLAACQLGKLRASGLLGKETSWTPDKFLRAALQRCYNDFRATTPIFDKAPRAVVTSLAASAEAGYAPAQYELALLYRHGLAVPRNDSLAEEWLQRALAQAYPSARLEVALAGPWDGQSATWNRNLARAEALASSLVGRDTHGPVQADFQHARDALQLALEPPAEDATPAPVPSEPLLPDDYENLPDIAAEWHVSLSEARRQMNVVRWSQLARLEPSPEARYQALLKGAELGDADLMVGLGTALAAGRGCHADLVEAYRWYCQAATLGKGAAERDALAARLAPTDVRAAQAQALAWWQAK
ncbi:MAG: uncharacterized protein JWM80_105 [Cyanobacteria bacterium RYN_339]|nr:uncharacterized protein [Cyanobacteria bacterium RYN_339]